jgi:asparagine synthase (glutamine-hydrolysing)
MCGIAGFMGGVIEIDTTLRKMTDALTHRGPNSSGIWIDKSKSIALGHRRLSILDPSSAGNQPMMSKSGRYTIVFNGEIYNHLELREELNSLKNHTWFGHSDTETLLTCIEYWGLETSLKKFLGMFAIALWDKDKQELHLARDRIGEKPLYYGWQGSGKFRTFLFGSELKALKLHPAFESKVDRNSLCLLMRHNYIPAPHSIYSGIFKLEPGSILRISLAHPTAKIIKYWDFIDIASSSLATPFKGGVEDAIENLDNLIRDAIKLQMISDVPLGAFLSGGIDSSTIVALMQAQRSKPIKTFTIGFNESAYNEADHAKAVAAYLGTDHTELYVTADEAMAVIPKLPSLFDEPFADSSQIPTFLVSQLAKHDVTVCLSGDAGDELFCGYNRYKLTASMWSKLSIAPSDIRKMMSKSILSISPDSWNEMGRFFGSNNLGHKMHKAAKVITSNSIDQLYLHLISHWDDPASIVLGGVESIASITKTIPLLAEFNPIQKMMAFDTIGYLPDDILVKVDRASMGVSLESRIPFLDHRVIEFAWKIPQNMKLRQGQTKWILRQVLYRYMPKDLIERPKQGFGVPIDIWLRGPLRDWAENLLDENRLLKEGYFNPEPIRVKWLEHLSGKRNWHYHLWNVLMFQAWLENEHK